MAMGSSRRSVLAAGAALVATGLPDRASAAGLPTPLAPPRYWGGINHSSAIFPAEPLISASIRCGNDLGIKAVRLGMNGLGGASEGAPFTWANHDALLNKYRDQGFQVHSTLSFRERVKRPTIAQWDRNWRYFVRNVMSRYRDHVRVWIIDNEPERGFGGYYPTPTEAVKFTRIAWEELHDLGIDDRCMIESPPVAAPDTGYLGAMLDVGLAGYCHSVGTHCYGSQIEDGRIRRPWDRLAALGVTNVCVGISESGALNEYMPSDYVGGADAWRAYWHRHFRLQAKAFGYEYALLFDLDNWKQTKQQWRLAAYDPALGTHTPLQPVWDTLRASWGAARTFANGDFESPEDGVGTWMIWPRAIGSRAVVYASITFPSDASKARRGSGCCRMALAGHSRELAIRQVADQLVPGRRYQVTAWAFLTGGRATLKAMGFNRFNGVAEATAITTTPGSWVQLSVRVLPSNPWLVVSLHALGTNKPGQEIRWDDVTVSEVV